MAKQKGGQINTPAKGLNRDSWALNEADYVHLQNGNFDNFDGGTFTLTNEMSNILSSKFKLGFKVIGFKNDLNTENTYFFLVNPTTGVGEFGVIKSNQLNSDLEDLTSGCDECLEIRELSTPLEDLEQVELQTYITLISDECKPTPADGFNFSVFNPIKSPIIKDEKCGKTIYFTDNLNPPRHINIDRIEDYFIQNVPCEDDIAVACADFEKMRIFKKFNIPKLTPVSIELGGQLRLGVYEFLIAYCDANGNEISEYYSITTPISIFDRNNVILEQPELASRTNFAIRLDVEGLDNDYTHYKVAVIQTADIDFTPRYFIEGIHVINDTTILYGTEQNKVATSVDNLARTFLKVELTEGMTSSNNILFQHGVTNKKEINLQPVVNFLGEFMRFQTHIASEDLYTNGVATSLYTGYNRDEVVPFGIKFLLDGGFETAIFPLVGRVATAEDLEDVATLNEETGEYEAIGGNQDVASILANKAVCITTERLKKWQYYNTAELDPEQSVCAGDGIETVEVTEDVTKFCIVEDVAVLEAGTLQIDLEEEFTSLQDYINDNTGSSEAECNEAFINSTVDICDALYADYSSSVCELKSILLSGSTGTAKITVNGIDYSVTFNIDLDTTAADFVTLHAAAILLDTGSVITSTGAKISFATTFPQISISNLTGDLNGKKTEVFSGNCGTITYGDPIIEVSEVENEVQTFIEKEFATDYLKVVPPSTCNLHRISETTGGAVNDTDFKTEFLFSSENIYVRESDFINESCPYAAEIVENQNPTQNYAAGYFNNYKGTLLGTEDLVVSKEVTCNDYIETLDFSTGTSGSVTVTIDATTFTTLFSGTIISTAILFYSTHKVAIEALTGGTLSISSAKVTLTTPTLNYIKSVTTTGDLRVIYSSEGFTNKIHSGALYFIGKTNGREKFILDVSKHKLATKIDIFSASPATQKVRISLFKSCSDTNAIFCEYITMNNGGIFLLEKSGLDLIITDETGTPYATIANGWFTSKKFYVVIDNEIKGDDVDDGGTFVQRWITFPTSGCYTVTTRSIENKRVDVTWDSITLRKKVELTSTCTYSQPIIQSCKAVPYRKGKFAYWESQENYPDNNDLYNSSTLTIPTDAIPSSIKTTFEDVFTTGVEANEYTLNVATTKLNCTPIRHFRMPDNKVAPFMYDMEQRPFASSAIFPLGVTIDENIINTFLDIAVINGLISQEDRDAITAYEILRGDLTLNRSVIASGLLYDARKYQEKSGGKYLLYPNYPFNTYGEDKMNLPFSGENRNDLGSGAVWGTSNRNYTFHSPETDYYQPTLPSELSIQGYMYGASRGHFDEVKQHPKWVILTSKARVLAGVLAGLEVSAEGLIRLAQMQQGAGTSFYTFAGISGVGLNIGGIISYVAGMVSVTLANVSKAITDYGRYRYEWLQIFENLGTLYNFAYYYYAEGNYNFIQLEQEQENQLRGINVGKYLNEGRYDNTNEVTTEKLTINNIDREKSVFLSTGAFPIVYPTNYKTFDKDNFTSSLTYEGEVGISESGRSSEVIRNIASPYVAIKNYLPQQHGTINSIKWLPTGYRGDLLNPSEGCLSIFGGDTIISRHTLKRKHSQFLVTSMKQADLTPFNYFFYNNIGRNPRFYVSYKIDKDFDSNGKLFPDIDTDKVLDNATQSGNYHRPPSKFYLWYYGIPNFLCETRINTNNRYAGTNYKEHFYPQVGDIGEWTQESVVSIREPNVFNYNRVYSRQVHALKLRKLSDTFDRDLNDCKTDFPNGVIYSLPDNSENSSYDPWLIYRPLDFYEFPTSWGKLKELKGIESSQVLARLANTVAIFNAVDTIVDDGKRPDSQFLGDGGVFARRPVTFSETDLGYGGTQTSMSVSCEFGHFHVDAKRGQVIQVQSGGKGIQEISAFAGDKPSGMRNWFKEHLPFKILKAPIAGIENIDTDNAYNGIGIVMGWDSRFRRIFITKKDYVVKDNTLTFENGKFYKEEVEVQLTNPTYFTEASWTIAYSPIQQSWMSFYDFKPNYYINHNDYFQTGINQTNDETELGLWAHLLTNKSYQVYYGKRYPFILEYQMKRSANNIYLHTVAYKMDILRYHNEYDFAEVEGGFDKLWISSTNTNSGELHLVPNTGQISLISKYPKTASDGSYQEVLVSKSHNEFSVNYFYNRLKHSFTNNPPWLWDVNQINKTINTNVVKFYGQSILTPLRTTVPSIRLEQSKESRLRYVFNLGLSKFEEES